MLYDARRCKRLLEAMACVSTQQDDAGCENIEQVVLVQRALGLTWKRGWQQSTRHRPEPLQCSWRWKTQAGCSIMICLNHTSS